VEAVSETLPPDCYLKRDPSRPTTTSFAARFRANQYDPHPVAAALKRLGLRGARSCDKYVPRAYLVAPIKVRHAVLQGLLDTDGTLNRQAGEQRHIPVRLQATRQQRLQWLAASLGGVARSAPDNERRKGLHSSASGCPMTSLHSGSQEG
jgi:ATP-dependent DNA helicase RecG